jgi:hypothetical protein
LITETTALALLDSYTDTFGWYLDRLSDFEDRGVKPLVFAQGRMEAVPENQNWFLFKPSNDPKLYPASVFLYAIQVLRNNTGLGDIRDLDVQARLRDMLNQYPEELDYDVGNEGAPAMSIKLDEGAGLYHVDDPEINELIRAGAISEDVFRHEPLDPDLLVKLAATVRLQDIV